MSDRLGAALDFVRRHGIVLASAKRDAPRLVEAVVGEPIQGNWWAHPEGRVIYNVLAAVSEAEDILVCRLLGGRVTLVHRRLWPALVRAAGHFDRERLAKIREEHTPSGRHVTRAIAFPDWVTPDVARQAASLSEEEALLALGPALPAMRGKAPPRARRASASHG